MKSGRRSLPFHRAVLLLTLLSGLPAIGVALVLLWQSGAGAAARWTLSTLTILAWLGLAAEVEARVVRPLRTLASVLEALRADDTTMHARGARRDDPLGEVLLEANALGDAMREKTLGALEASALLRAVMEQIDVAIFTFATWCATPPMQRWRPAGKYGCAGGWRACARRSWWRTRGRGCPSPTTSSSRSSPPSPRARALDCS